MTVYLKILLSCFLESPQQLGSRQSEYQSHHALTSSTHYFLLIPLQTEAKRIWNYNTSRKDLFFSKKSFHICSNMYKEIPTLHHV
jgi:hypothetical protein